MEKEVQSCAYHNDRSAIAACSECEAQICDACRQEVAGHVVCVRCVEAIRGRVVSEIEAQTSRHPLPDAPQHTHAPSESTPSPGGYEPALTPSIPIPPPGETSAALDPASVATPSIPIPPPSPARILVGIALGLAVGWLGAFVRAQVMYRANIQFGLIDSFIGFAVGYAVVLGSGRSGFVPGVIGGVIAFVAIAYGWYLVYGYALNDELVKIGGQQAASLFKMGSFLQEAPGIIRRWDVMDWVFVAIGVYGGFITPMRSPAPTASS